MARLQLHPDPNMNTDNHLPKLESDSSQSPGADSQMSFSVYEAGFSGSDTCLGALSSSTCTTGFLTDHPLTKGRMVPGYARRIRQLSVFLVLFIIVALVMTGLFVWRTVYYDSEDDADATRVHIQEVDFCSF